MWRNSLISLALIVLVCAAFSPAFGADFVAWDDDRNFLANEAYRGLSLQHLRWMLTTFHMGPYQPLSWVTLGIDHAFFGMDARGYHVTSVLIHAATVVAFYFLARRLFAIVRPAWSATASDLCAFAAAVLFGLHPLRVESVAWVTERRDVLSGFFFVVTVCAWIGYAARDDRRGLRYTLAFVFFVCALLSKASVVTLPLALLALDVWPLRRFGLGARHIVLEKLPFFAASALISILAIHGQSATGTALRGLADHGLVRRIEQSSYAAVFYPFRTLVPIQLTPIYDMPSPFDPFAARFIAALALCAALCASAWFLRRRAPGWSLAWVASLILLLPVSGLVSSGPHLVADRYSYLACMPFALLIAGCVGLVLERSAWRGLVIGITFVACVALGMATRVQTEYWRSSLALWERAYAVDPESAVACDHLGVMRVAQSQSPDLSVPDKQRLLDEAITLYSRAYQNAPHPNQLFNIGGAVLDYAMLLQDPKARAEELELSETTMRQGLDFAEKTTGISASWQVMHASVLVEMGRRDEARDELTRALRLEPNNVSAHQWLARIALEEGRTDDAIASLRHTTELEPQNARAWSILGKTYAQLGRGAEARHALDEAARLGGTSALPSVTLPTSSSPTHAR